MSVISTIQPSSGSAKHYDAIMSEGRISDLRRFYSLIF